MLNALGGFVGETLHYCLFERPLWFRAMIKRRVNDEKSSGRACLPHLSGGVAGSISASLPGGRRDSISDDDAVGAAGVLPVGRGDREYHRLVNIE